MDRNSYLYSEASNEKGLQTLLQAAAGMVIDKESLSDNVISCTNGKLRAYQISNEGWIPVSDN